MLHQLTFLTLCLILVPSPAAANGSLPCRPVRTQARTITVPPDLYTLGELAAKVSLTDAPVTASGRIARRLTFAHLKERSQEDTLRLIETAFAVKANPQPSPGRGFVLVDDPDVIKRERRWMTRFIAMVQQPASEMVEDYAVLLQMPPEQLVRERDRRGKEQAAMAAKAKPGTPSEQVFTALYKRYRRAVSAVDNRERLSERVAYLRNKQLIPTLVDETIRRSFSLRGEPFTVGNDTNNPAADTAYAVTYATFTHINENYSFKLWLNILYPDRKDEFQLTDTYGSSLRAFLFGSAKQGDSNGFVPLLGKDAAEWITAERDPTEKFLASEAARKELKLNPRLPSDAVSSRVWQWCVALDREALVEVWPSVDATEVEGGTLADVLRPPPCGAHGTNGVSPLSPTVLPSWTAPARGSYPRCNIWYRSKQSRREPADLRLRGHHSQTRTLSRFRSCRPSASMLLKGENISP